MHLLKKYVVIRVSFDSNNDEHKLFMDKITSEVIRVGGTVKASRRTLTMISPFLDKRLLGNYNMKIHNGLKQLYDPRDVLNPSAFFYLREKQDKSMIKRYMDKNK
jgi:FAD/FMN-containing dehydrogenase